MTHKEHELVMLPTKEKANGIIVIDSFKTIKSKMFIIDNNNYKHEDYAAQHLYIISSEEIKDDLQIDSQVCVFKSSNGQITTLAGKGYGRVKTPGHYYSIIATTDESLSAIPKGETFAKLISEIPRSFIQYYVEQYNKGNIITKVMVEYGTTKNDAREFVQFVWVSPDNTISIKPTKDSWTREEVTDLIRKVFNDLAQAGQDKWIKENL